jgi:hypothetical protein
MASTASRPRFLLCISNEGHPAALEVRKVYQALPDPAAAERHDVRVVEESGEDYLYPEAYFVPIELPRAAERAFVHAS